MSNIPSSLDTATFRHLVLEAISNPLPVVEGFQIPIYNDVVFQYDNGSFPTKPTYITFKQNGTNVYALDLSYDANGALTRVVQD
jgi:hypothetical protein